MFVYKCSVFLLSERVEVGSVCKSQALRAKAISSMQIRSTLVTLVKLNFALCMYLDCTFCLRLSLSLLDLD